MFLADWLLTAAVPGTEVRFPNILNIHPEGVVVGIEGCTKPLPPLLVVAPVWRTEQTVGTVAVVAPGTVTVVDPVVAVAVVVGDGPEQLTLAS